MRNNINIYRTVAKIHILLALCLLCTASFAQTSKYLLPQDVKTAFEKSDMKHLSAYIAPTIEISLPTGSGIYGKRQAEMVLNEYLQMHKGMTMNITGEENVLQATKTNGKISHNGKTMFISILFQRNKNSIQIKQIRIDDKK